MNTNGEPSIWQKIIVMPVAMVMPIVYPLGCLWNKLRGHASGSRYERGMCFIYCAYGLFLDLIFLLTVALGYLAWKHLTIFHPVL